MSYPPSDVRQSAPQLAQRQWVTPLTDGRWRGRLRLSGAELQRRWAEFLGQLAWEFFVTLTFDPKRVFPAGREVVSREAFWWCGLVGHLSRRPIGWAYAAERGSGGAWHAHVLVIGVGDASWSGPTAGWRQRNGFISIQPVADGRRASVYTCKSVADDEVVLSDTLGRYRTATRDDVSVPLYRSAR